MNLWLVNMGWSSKLQVTSYWKYWF